MSAQSSSTTLAFANFNSQAVASQSSPCNLVIGTNDSSIVSKRSAERAGYFKHPQHLRHFVQKFQRRAPLINLGYTIRTLCVDLVIKRFLDGAHARSQDDSDGRSIHPSKSKVVLVNLGCGYDPGFFKLVLGSNDLGLQQEFQYIDVDYPELISRKHQMISQSKELCSVFDGFAKSTPGSWIQTIDGKACYALLGCDLCQTSQFVSSLIDLLKGQMDHILFVSEVSTVYMPPEKSEELLNALSQSFPKSVWACLEQVLRPTPTAFSETMLKHFQKLQTPLRGTIQYPTISNQVNRLQKYWENVETSTMQEIWNDFDNFPIMREERHRLMTLEPFDEWEELDLFLSHYIVAIAYSQVESMPYFIVGPTAICLPPLKQWPKESVKNKDLSQSNEPSRSWFYRPTDFSIQRRGHTLTPLPDRRRHLIFGGFGPETSVNLSSHQQSQSRRHSRLAHPFILEICEQGTIRAATSSFGSFIPSARLYHTASIITDKNQVSSVLLFGGRHAPQTPLEDAYLLDCTDLTWNSITSSLENAQCPPPRFRHSATSIEVENCQHVLIHGGIGDKEATLSDTWLFDSNRRQWIRLPILDHLIGPRYSHQLYYDHVNLELYVFGGVSHTNDDSADPRLAKNIKIHIQFTTELNVQSCSKSIKPVQFQSHDALLHRYSHCITTWDNDNLQLILSGGLVENGVIDSEYQCMLLDLKRMSCLPLQVSYEPSRSMIGHKACVINLNHSEKRLKALVLLGGGMTCFSFGSHFDSFLAMISNMDLNQLSNRPRTNETIKNYATFDSSPQDTWNQVQEIPQSNKLTIESWNDAIFHSTPIIFKAMDIGDCKSLWTAEYLKTKIGKKKCSVHVSDQSSNLTWHDKNFSYKTMNFDKLLEQAFHTKTNNNQAIYLRSLSNSPKQTSNFDKDFPELSQDFKIPKVMQETVGDNLFSSVLRISSANMGLWAHYDTYDNILVQIKGKKLIRMWHPSEIINLYIKDSSSIIPDFDQPDLDRFPLYRKSHPMNYILEPGDIVFIPSNWIHSIKSIDSSLAINLFFFSNLNKKNHLNQLKHKDIWGNQDLSLIKNIQKDFIDLLNSNEFFNLPILQRQFYLKKFGMDLIRLADEQK
ncbi:hypothetical protein O181_019748 [Austropuccinia psidii MF-1]|uniref:tRNA wybutosine-synthesizing protein 4 n=1 Tax=Austropuccinia psidii MF-1 TaxID=1389203 RepID=A0A9Q3CA73_9BASI|nr:hypothetical protein [Austropuccinia psidii MF-1]